MLVMMMVLMMMVTMRLKISPTSNPWLKLALPSVQDSCKPQARPPGDKSLRP